MSNTNTPEPLLTPSQVARRFSVDPKTVTRWARTGKLPFVRTLGGHRRYPKSVVDKLAETSVENVVTESGE